MGDSQSPGINGLSKISLAMVKMKDQIESRDSVVTRPINDQFFRRAIPWGPFSNWSLMELPSEVKRSYSIEMYIKLDVIN